MTQMNDVARAAIPVDDVMVAARELARGGRWQRAASLLDAAATSDPQAQARIALAAAEVALEGGWFDDRATPTERHGLPTKRLEAAQALFATTDLDAGTHWDLAFLRLRWAYFEVVMGTGTFQPGPEGKDMRASADLGRRAEELHSQAPDQLRRGWARMYLGLIADNVFGERAAAPAHYEAALRAGQSGDDLLTAQALRHLGDHDHDRGDHELALQRWRQATAPAAGSGSVPGTLAQQMLLAVLARQGGDVAAATALAREIARWAAALGAQRLAAQANNFLTQDNPAE